MLRIVALCVLMTGCTVSEEMIANKELYCSGIYKGIRAVGRVTTEAVSYTHLTLPTNREV